MLYGGVAEKLPAVIAMYPAKLFKVAQMAVTLANGKPFLTDRKILPRGAANVPFHFTRHLKNGGAGLFTDHLKAFLKPFIVVSEQLRYARVEIAGFLRLSGL